MNPNIITKIEMDAETGQITVHGKEMYSMNIFKVPITGEAGTAFNWLSNLDEVRAAGGYKEFDIVVPEAEGYLYAREKGSDVWRTIDQREHKVLSISENPLLSKGMILGRVIHPSQWHAGCMEIPVSVRLKDQRPHQL